MSEHTDITAPQVATTGVTDPVSTVSTTAPNDVVLSHLKQLLVSVGHDVADEFDELVSLAIKRAERQP